MLSAYADGALSPDAQRSMQQHLQRCAACATALEREQRFLHRLDEMAEVSLPADFVNAVMGRVAQYPTPEQAHRIPWRAAARWVATAGIVIAAALAGVAAWLVGSGTLEKMAPGNLLAAAVGRLTLGFASLIAGLSAVIDPAMVLLEETGKLAWKLSAATLTSGWVVQLTLLTLTISLNYALTRLVASYQRRR